jgi:hypothetical protein
MDLIRRMEATQLTVDTFKGKVFDDGKVDCVQLVDKHARNLGYKKLKVPKYNDMATAAAAMKQLGFRTLAEVLDHHFMRIPIHEVLAGDIVEGPGGNGFSALGIAVGNGRILAFHEEIPHADILQPLFLTGAWRVEVR